MILVDAKEMQEIDLQAIEEFGIKSIVLMENAGKGAWEIFLKSFSNLEDKSISVIAGKGNNGGDGFVIARYLFNQGFNIKIFLLAKKNSLKNDTKINCELAQKLKIPIFEIENQKKFQKYKKDFKKQDIWIDAIFGTGLKSNIKGFFKDIIEFINKQKKPVFAIDIPSGIDADRGRICGVAIKARVTASFAYAKIGHMVLPGSKYSGKLHIVEIGIPNYIQKKINPKQYAITTKSISQKLKKRTLDSHKGSNGHILIFAGSVGKSGACIMAAKSALKSGAGLVSCAVFSEINNIIETNLIEAMSIPLDSKKNILKTLIKSAKKKQAIIIGPGLGQNKETKKISLDFIKNTKIPIIIDADALNFIAENKSILKKLNPNTVLTPHPKEMARLIDIDVQNLQKNRFEIAKKFATKYKIHLVLKGAKTIIASPNGSVFINTSGNSGMATGGMGDVLCGIIASFIAQGYDICDSCQIAVFLHGFAGDILYKKIGAIGFLPTELINFIPIARERLINSAL